LIVCDTCWLVTSISPLAEFIRLPDCEQMMETMAPKKPSTSTTRRAGKMRTTSITSSPANPAAANEMRTNINTTSG
jgi:hypothetical protein